FELEVLRRLVHLRREVFDEAGEVVARGGGGAGPGGVGDLRLGRLPVTTREELLGVNLFASEHVGDVSDAFAKRGRVDPVLGVVGELDVAAPVGLFDRVAHRV